MKIIDGHIHCCSSPYFNQIAEEAAHVNTTEHLRTVFQEEGIVHGIVMGNQTLDLSYHQYPEFLSYCIGLDSNCLNARSLTASIDKVEQHLQRKNCVGIKLYPGYNSQYVFDTAYFPYYELAKTYDKPVAIHTGDTAGTGGLLKYSHPLTIDEVAVAFPQVTFVMCHLGNPWIVDGIAVVDKNDNVAADLSGLFEGMVDPQKIQEKSKGYLEHLRTWLGYLDQYDKLLYGTDWPLVNIPNYIAFIKSIIPEAYYEDVFYKNALRIYRPANIC